MGGWIAMDKCSFGAKGETEHGLATFCMLPIVTGRNHSMY